MEGDEIPKIPRCEVCNSSQIRTTNKYQICNRCGFRKEIE